MALEITSIDPVSATQGDENVEITVNGTGFEDTGAGAISPDNLIISGAGSTGYNGPMYVEGTHESRPYYHYGPSGLSIWWSPIGEGTGQWVMSDDSFRGGGMGFWDYSTGSVSDTTFPDETTWNVEQGSSDAPTVDRWFVPETITVSGAGTTAYNGEYALQSGLVGFKRYWTKGGLYLENTGGWWELGDHADPAHYEQFTDSLLPPKTDWATGFGENPAPTLSYDTEPASVDGTDVTFEGTGITVNSVTFVDSTELTVDITLAGDATVGDRDVTATNEDEETDTLTDGFEVLSAAPAPVLGTVFKGDLL